MALDDPTEGKEGEAGEQGGAPSVRVPLAVFSGGILPLILERGRIRVHRLRWVHVNFLVVP